MQRAVSDSDVIIHLAKLNELNLIKELYECAHIPRYVELEMVRCQYDEFGIILRGMNQGGLTKEEAIKLLNELKAREFRIHPNIIESAIDSVEG